MGSGEGKEGEEAERVAKWYLLKKSACSLVHVVSVILCAEEVKFIWVLFLLPSDTDVRASPPAPRNNSFRPDTVPSHKPRQVNLLLLLLWRKASLLNKHRLHLDSL